VVRNRLLYPKSGFGVADLVRYYKSVAPVLLPHLRGRPVSFRRFPATIDEDSYWEKDAPAFTPKWIKTVPVPRQSGESDLRYILVEDEPTLAWAASVGCIELHPFLHCYPEITRPSSVVFDLDPGEGAGLIQCCTTALQLREFFEEFGLRSFVKVSGGKGMQVYLPLNTPITYTATQSFAKRVAEMLAAERPQLIVSESAKSVRAGRILIDWGQNAQQKSNVAVYSLRAVSDAPLVSVPMGWAEIDQAIRTTDLESLMFSPEAAINRTAQLGNLFAPVLTLRQELPPQLLREWKIISAPSNVISLSRASRNSTETLERSSGQGGRKGFIVYSPAKDELQIALEVGDEFRCWRFVDAPQSGNEIKVSLSESSCELIFLARSRRFPVWDKGTYELIEGGFHTGEMVLYFSGEKLTSEWRLTREKAEWTFQQEPMAEDSTGIPQSSSGAWKSVPFISQPQRSTAVPQTGGGDSLPAGPPRFFEPMEADEVDRPDELPTNRAEWLYEVKWDGFRAVAVKRNGSVRVYGRTGKPLENCRHEHLDRALAESSFRDGVIDGEVVAFRNGVASFQTLQNSLRNNAPVVFVTFDVLNYEGRDLTTLSYVERRAFLNKLQPLLPSLFPISESIDADVFELLKTFAQRKIEGVVAKRRDAYYRPGKTSHAWVKYWIGELGEFVIGGYMPGKDRYLEALAVGEYIEGKLIYREQIRHGFTVADKQSILASIRDDEVPECPFHNLPQKKRRGAVDDIRMDQYVWVQPKVRCLMRYKERTAAGEIREHGKFIELLENEAA
jgi:bifunctional non-homologous end joining protein LigD